ncbi:transposase [Aquisphaera insulae]|uniref:transposase n=1 Tax=Aquisphaera insulae TaxID=2712864 RepID=UPI0013ED2D2B|nr:transposase [Aquisphaera insulae]
MSRLLNNEDIPFCALIEPAQDAVRADLGATRGEFVLIVHDWCMFNFNQHTSKADRLVRSHKSDMGYELGTALAIDAADGRPLGPMEFRLRTGAGMLSTRVGGADLPRGHVDEIAAVMGDAQRWGLRRRLVHVIDREADSVGHYRQWHADGHRFLVRSDESRLVRHDGRERKLDDVVADLRGRMQDVRGAMGLPEVVMIGGKAGRVRVAEAEVILHRPARHNTGEKTAGGSKKQVEVPGPPLPLRLVVVHVVDGSGVVLAEWRLLTNIPAEDADAATIGRWYGHRWGIETYHKLLKSSGMNAEQWQQQSGEAFLRRLCVASMACLTVWHLQREESEEAARLRETLVRLSGRQMKHRVESTAPALLAGLERLLAIDDLMRREDLEDILALARRVIPRLFPDRSG